jgi:DNA mismatch repair protein MutL
MARARVAEGRPPYPHSFPRPEETADAARDEPRSDPPGSFDGGGGHRQPRLFPSARFGELRVIGQYGGTYILCESADGLVLVDQHAAHERIVYERLRRDGADRPPAQQLLVPETLEMRGVEAARLAEAMPAFAPLGLEMEPFGGTTFVIRSVPALLGGRAAAPLVREIAERLAALDDGGGSDAGDPLNEVRKLMACHGAIRAGQRLTDREMADLLRQLDDCETPSHCPHGRPTWVRWTPRALERAFGRVA